MNRHSLALAAVAACAVTWCGCGTVCNLASTSPQPYGGVEKDIEFVSTPSETDFSNSGQIGVIVFALCAADICVSGVADTLTLPLLVLREKKALSAPEDVPDLPAQYSCGATVSAVP
jgi:uncharacterized protein YceK